MLSKSVDVVKVTECHISVVLAMQCGSGIGNESVPIQLAQCRLPGLAISSAKMLMYFSHKIY